MNRFKDTEAIKTTSTKSLIRALVISMGLTFIIFAIFSLIISFSSISEASADTMVTVATAVAIAVSGFIAAKGASSKGWMWGMLGGLTYIIAVWLIGILSNGRFIFDSNTLIAFALSAIIGAFGGIVGINVKR